MGYRPQGLLNSTLALPDMTMELTQSDSPGSKLVFWGVVRPICVPMPASGDGGGITLVLLQTLPPPKLTCKISQVLKTLSQLLPHPCSPQRAEELNSLGWAWDKPEPWGQPGTGMGLPGDTWHKPEPWGWPMPGCGSHPGPVASPCTAQGRQQGRQHVILGNQEVRSCCLNAAT